MSEKLETVYVCVKCGKKVSYHRKTCPRCGATLIKKVRRRKRQ